MLLQWSQLSDLTDRYSDLCMFRTGYFITLGQVHFSQFVTDIQAVFYLSISTSQWRGIHIQQLINSPSL